MRLTRKRNVLTSLAFSMVMEVSPGGTVYGPGKDEVEVP